MNVLICYDVDGTLETSNGPVTVARMQQLAKDGAHQAIVSPSSAAPPYFKKFLIDGRPRVDNLRAARAHYEADEDGPLAPFLCLYVSDNKDYGEAEAAGFTYIEAAQFR